MLRGGTGQSFAGLYSDPPAAHLVRAAAHSFADNCSFTVRDLVEVLGAAATGPKIIRRMEDLLLERLATAFVKNFSC